MGSISKAGMNKLQFITPETVDTFRTEHADVQVVEAYEQQLIDLQDIHYGGEVGEAWIYYPWQKKLLHCVGNDALFALRTNRNKLLITAEEQQKLRQAVIGVAGMSVGSGIALGSVYSGMSDTIKIADRDTLDSSNLNRLRESLLSVGQPKVDLAARHIYELSPFADVRIFEAGVTADSIDSFFDDPTLSVVVDEIDDFKMKVQMRVHAKARKIPLLMFTSLGDNILVDVERYDLNPDLKVFNGLLGDVPDEVLANPEIGIEDIKRYSVQLVGQQYIPTRALESLTKMGTELVGRPQLYSTIAVDGGLAAYTIRQIILGAQLASGRYFVKLSDVYNLNSDELADTEQRKAFLDLLFKPR
jgi:hypothetical protein